MNPKYIKQRGDAERRKYEKKLQEINELSKALLESKKKFDYFFLGVVLGLLALSIQTDKPTDFHVVSWLLMVFWGLLLISFFSGLYRQELIIKIIDVSLKMKEAEHSEYGNISDSTLKRYLIHHKLVNILFYLQKWLFIVAIIAYGILKVIN